MRVCSSCGEQLREGASFCGGCGAVGAPAAVEVCGSCSTPLNVGWEFCGACGAPVAGPGSQASSGPARRSRLKLVAAVAGAAGAVAAVAIVVASFIGRGSDDGGDLDFASPPRVDQGVVATLNERFAALPAAKGENDRDQVRDLIGPPDAFVLSWESVGNKPEPVRYETWFYYELLSAYEFAEGRLISNLPIDDEDAVLLLPLQYDPAKFDRGLSWGAVANMIADPGSAATGVVPKELEVGLTAYAAEQLLVVFDDEGLVYAESIPLRGGTR